MIGQEAKDQLTNDSTGKGNVSDIFEGVGVDVDVFVLDFQSRVDGTDDLAAALET